MQHDFVREDTSDVFLGVSDEELARLAAQKNSLAFSELLNRYTKLMLYRISCVKPVGADADDFMQECSLALLDAVGGYSDDGRASFKTYACVCIDHRLKSVLRRSEREKNKPLADYVELYDYLESRDSSGEVSTGSDPEEQMLIRESTAELQKQLRELLSDFEYRVFIMFLEGHSYEEIAKITDMSAKTVDNALQRARRKLRRGHEQSGENGKNG